MTANAASPALAVALDGNYGFDVARAFVQQAKTDHHPADVLLFPEDHRPIPRRRRGRFWTASPGYVFLAGKTAELGPVAEALRSPDYTGDFGASDGFYNADTITTYGKYIDGCARRLVDAAARPRSEHRRSSLPISSTRSARLRRFSAYGYAAAQLMIAASQRGNASTRSRS